MVDSFQNSGITKSNNLDKGKKGRGPKDVEKRLTKLLSVNDYRYSKGTDAYESEDIIPSLGLGLMRKQRRKWRNHQNKINKNKAPIPLSSCSSEEEVSQQKEII